MSHLPLLLASRHRALSVCFPFLTCIAPTHVRTTPSSPGPHTPQHPGSTLERDCRPLSFDPHAAEPAGRWIPAAPRGRAHRRGAPAGEACHCPPRAAHGATAHRGSSPEGYLGAQGPRVHVSRTTLSTGLYGVTARLCVCAASVRPPISCPAVHPRRKPGLRYPELPYEEERATCLHAPGMCEDWFMANYPDDPLR